MYLFEVERLALLVVPDGVVLLVVESDAGLVLSDSLVVERLNEVGPLVDDDVVLDVGVLLILDLEVVGGELLDGEVGAADGTLVADDVGSLGYSTVQQVVNVGLVCFSHLDMIIKYLPPLKLST